MFYGGFHYLSYQAFQYVEVVLLICDQFWGHQSMYSKSIQMWLPPAATDITPPSFALDAKLRHAWKASSLQHPLWLVARAIHERMSGILMWYLLLSMN